MHWQEMNFIGIDPGLEGGVAILSPVFIKAERTPIMNGEKRTMNLPECANFLKYCDCKDSFAVIEKVHAMPQQGVSSTFSFGKGYGSWLGILATLGIPYTEVSPQAWKKMMLADTDKSKEASLNRASTLFPLLNLIPPGCRTPSDGIAEAALLAEYGRRVYLVK